MTSTPRKMTSKARTPGAGQAIDLQAVLAAKAGTTAAQTAPAQVPAQHRDDLTPRFVDLDQITPNPLNTRRIDPCSESIGEMADSFVQHKQLTPCAVVSRYKFVALFPEFRNLVSDATYVQVNGGRRYATVVRLQNDGHADFTGLDVIVRNDLAESRDLFVAATAAENLDRRNYDPVEEAHAIALLVRETNGRQDLTALQLTRSEGWVTQRLNILKLAEPVQAALAAGKISLREVRQGWHTLPFEEQIRLLEVALAPAPASESAAGGSDPAADAKPEAASKRAGAAPRRVQDSRITIAIHRLGKTPPKIAASLIDKLPREQVQELIEELQSRLSGSA